MITNKNITTFDAHLDKNYGAKGTKSRDQFEEEFDSFKIGVLIQEARKRKQLTPIMN
jgi:hypothetical protein